jgi:tetratricopeptide (TPR) repeat protein
MKFISAILWITLFLIATVSFSATRQEYYNAINDVWKTRDYNPAIKTLEKAVLEYPDTADFFSNLTYLYSAAARHAKAIILGEKSYRKFPGHRYIRKALVNAYLQAGWARIDQKEIQKAEQYFKAAYLLEPEDPDCLNAYGYIRRMGKNYPEAIALFEKGLKKTPDHPYLRNNLAWTYWEMGNGFSGEDPEKAYAAYRKAYETHRKNEIQIHTAILYKASEYKKWMDAFHALEAARKQFPGHPELFAPSFWLYYHHAVFFRDQKDYRKMIASFLKLQDFTRNHPSKIWQDKRTYFSLAFSEFYHRLMEMTNNLWPYWKKIGPAQKKEAESYLKLLDGSSEEIKLLSALFRGQILYREGRVEEAKKLLDGVYEEIASMEPYREKLKEVKIPFPLKGTYLVENYRSSRYITHMGADRYCYDISGSDNKGQRLKTGKTGEQLSDYYGFDAEIYSPVDGVVLSAQDGIPDRTKNSPMALPGNYLQILSGEKVFLFYHLKNGSLTVKKGDRVRAGDVIGKLGNSASFEPHLHFGVYSADMVLSYPVSFVNYSVLRNKEFIPVSSGKPGKCGNSDLIKTE